MLIRFYWDEAGAYIASDLGGEFAAAFAKMCAELGKPDRIRVGPREGFSTDYAAGADVHRDDSKCDDCARPHNDCACS